MGAEQRWNPGQHPAPAELLLAHEDQLPREQAEPVLAHLHQCWQCRAHVEQYQRGIDAYVKFREIHCDPAVKPEPGGWLRLAARMRNAGSPPALKPAAFWKPLWIAFPALAAATVCAVLFWPAQLTATVVLDRAIRAESAPEQARSLQRVTIRRGGRTVVEDEFTLRKAYIDPSRPMSVRSFRTWHDSLRRRHDSVATVQDEIRVETTTSEGEIALARIDLTRIDYQPHAKHVELRDGTSVDVEAVDVNAVESLPAVREERVASAPAPADSAKAKLTAGEREALEMEVRWALHQMDADLGEPLEIQGEGSGLVVSGTLDDATRRDQILAALAGLPRVTAHLAVGSADAGLIANAEPIKPDAAAAEPLLAVRLQQELPDPGVRGAFVSRALALARDILRHSWALHRLAERYPASAETALPAEARTKLAQLVEAHRSALRSETREAASLWKPYSQLDGSVESPPAGWQAAALARLPVAQSFDHLTVRLLAAGGDDGLSAPEALRQLSERHRELNP